MSIVKLLNFLKLDRVTQTSFAEYHFKQNFVEHSTKMHRLVLRNTRKIWRVWQKKYEGQLLYRDHLGDINCFAIGV